jgi:CubicO group peptidase (beta-lactamase class C family)
MPFSEAGHIVLEAIARRAFPAAAVEVGTARAVLWREAFGHLTYDADAPATRLDTIFDLASLTKVIATTTVVMRLAEQARLQLSDPIGRWIRQWRGEATIEDALSHTTGLPAWLPLFRECQGREAFVAAIAGTPLEYQPRSASVYSDLGFILLGFIAEDVGGAPLDRLFESIRSRLGLDDLAFRPPDSWRPRTAPTGYDPWRKRLLVGEVHDENAAALGGVAGHAGLFGTSSAVGRFAQSLLRARYGEADACEVLVSQDTVIRFTARRDIPGGSRALAWDTMLPTSSCGTRMSSLAFGHTGFTGASLWLDPVKDLYVVFLTNRVYPSRENDLINEVRPAFHDAVVTEALQAPGSSGASER